MRRCGSILLPFTLLAVLFTALIWPPPVSTAAPTEITFWHPFASGVARDAVESLVAEFNASQNDIVVVTVIVPDIVEKVQVAILGGAPPDLATNLYPWREGTIGMLTDLTSYAARDGITLEDEFFPAGIAESYYQNTLYALPWFHVTHPVLYYRVDAYNEAGLDPDAPPATWEQLHLLGQRLTKRQADGLITQFSFDWGAGAAEHAFPMYYRVAGGEYLNPAGREVIVNNDLGRYVLNWLTHVRADIQADLSVATGTFYDRGRVHMINGNWVANTIRDSYPHLEAERDWAMAPFPVPEGASNHTVMSTRFLAIPTGAPNAEAAWTFAKWLAGPEANRQYALQRGLLPANRDAVVDPAFIDEFLFWDVQLAMLNSGIPEWGSVAIPDLVNFLAIMQNAYNRALTGTAPDAALEDAARQMQVFLNEHLD